MVSCHLRYRVHTPLPPLDSRFSPIIFDNSAFTTRIDGTWWIYEFQSNQPPAFCTDLRLCHRRKVLSRCAASYFPVMSTHSTFKTMGLAVARPLTRSWAIYIAGIQALSAKHNTAIHQQRSGGYISRSQRSLTRDTVTVGQETPTGC
jgi:hypothetical protein